MRARPLLTLHVYDQRLRFTYRVKENSCVRLVTLACTGVQAPQLHDQEEQSRTILTAIELKKYCKWCNAHTVHKETR
ncbi:MAG: 50S ribosomal protein L33 [Adlercreutzia equolifaciens]